MKAFVVFTAFLLSGAQAEVSSSLVTAALHAKWSSFKAEHKKAYHPKEESLRMANYLDNTRVIEEHNARFHQGLESFEMGHNQFSDLTLEEVQSTHTGIVVSPNDAETPANVSFHSAPSDVAAPGNIDWRSQRCVQRVKSQGGCGSCYAFAALASLETSHCIRRNGELPDLSEQHIVDCGGKGCGGGNIPGVFDYVLRNGGAINTRDYPYVDGEQSCQQHSKPKSVRMSTYKRIAYRNEMDLMHALATVGTVSVSYDTNSIQHTFYRGGILDSPSCAGKHTHGVVVVGYGTEGGKDFWILKNSWGTRWGENGYFRMARGKNMCGIAEGASYPIAA